MSKAEDKDFKKYKHKSLYAYSSTEWMNNSTKKYRRVFNSIETTYLYAEFSFFNKLFDEENWNAKIKLVCTKKENNQESQVCEVMVDKEVKMDENVAVVREGWGQTTPGSFWKKGEYQWKAFIDDVLVASSKFYIEEEEAVTENSNPFFSIDSIKLFEADNIEPRQADKKYCTVFNGKETRYIWTELIITNLLKHDWYGEIFFNFYNDADLLKGSTSELVYITGEKRMISSGWGGSNKGTWFNDAYRVDIVFMDQLIAAVPFAVGDVFEEGIPEQKNMGVGAFIKHNAVSEEAQKQSLDELLAKMDELVGMDNIKQKIRDYVKYLNFLKLRKEKGINESSQISLHAVLTGNPGTGKTTIAKQLGKIYKEMGLLTKGHVHEVDRADLVGEYIGQTAPKVKKEIENARGGILFIDEAYALSRSGEDSKDFGKEVIEIVIKEMSDGKGDLAVVVAGYPQEMKTFLESNPGLKSRFNHYFHFDDYMPEELLQIADLGFKNRALTITPDAREYLFTRFTQAYRDRDRTFGNARFVISVVDEGKMNMGLRLMQLPNVNDLTEAELSTVTKEDIGKIFSVGLTKQLDLQVDDKLLKEALAELNALVGLQNVKEEINELVKLVKYYKEIGKDVLNKFVLHSVFVGNPGTGKTTVARIFAKIFRALGILEKGHLIECDREGLVAGFSGQTAIKTADAVEKALGGVLFVDEAYSLCTGNNDQFGMEAINTLLKRMEDNRDDFVVIAAGYTDNMHEFLMTNPGLRSRFERTFVFNDYSPEELMSIADNMLKLEGLKTDAPAREHLTQFFSYAHENRDKFFGNAREVRKVIQESVKNQHLRMASVTGTRTIEMIETLTIDDVKEFNIDAWKESSKKKGGTLGFKFGAGNG